MLRVLLLIVFLTACSGTTHRAPLHRSPLMRTDWTPLITGRSLPASDSGHAGSGDQVEADKTKQADLRRRVISRARDILGKGSHNSSYGTADLSAILDKVLPGLDWDDSQGLESLMELARDAGAYHRDGQPSPGDIILFDNQRDTNGNGRADDRLTGCGVLMDIMGDRLTIMGRTGHGPREIVAWPGGPARDRLDGEKINSFLRIPHRSDPPDTEYLACRLFSGYIDIEQLAQKAR